MPAGHGASLFIISVVLCVCMCFVLVSGGGSGTACVQAVRRAMGGGRHAHLTSTCLPLHALRSATPPTFPSLTNRLLPELNKRIVWWDYSSFNSSSLHLIHRFLWRRGKSAFWHPKWLISDLLITGHIKDHAYLYLFV